MIFSKSNFAQYSRRNITQKWPDILLIYSVTKYLKLAIGRSSHQRCSTEIGALKKVTKFTGKHLFQSLFFNNVTGLRPATLFKKKALAQVVSCDICEIFKSIFWQNTSGWLLLHRRVGSNRIAVSSNRFKWDIDCPRRWILNKDLIVIQCHFITIPQVE